MYGQIYLAEFLHHGQQTLFAEFERHFYIRLEAGISDGQLVENGFEVRDFEFLFGFFCFGHHGQLNIRFVYLDVVHQIAHLEPGEDEAQQIKTHPCIVHRKIQQAIRRRETDLFRVNLLAADGEESDPELSLQSFPGLVFRYPLHPALNVKDIPGYKKQGVDGQ